MSAAHEVPSRLHAGILPPPFNKAFYQYAASTLLAFEYEENLRDRNVFHVADLRIGHVEHSGRTSSQALSRSRERRSPAS